MPTINKTIRIFNYIQEYGLKYGEAPTFEEIGAEFLLNSSASVYEHMKKMEARGWIRRSRAWRGIEITRVDAKVRTCQKCRRIKPVNEFGRNAEMADGRAVICKRCNQNAARALRLDRKENIKALKPEERIIRAVEQGYHTRELIRASTRLQEDEVSDLLAILWDKNKLRIVKKGEVKEFHLAESKAA